MCNNIILLCLNVKLVFHSVLWRKNSHLLLFWYYQGDHLNKFLSKVRLKRNFEMKQWTYLFFNFLMFSSERISNLLDKFISTLIMDIYIYIFIWYSPNSKLYAFLPLDYSIQNVLCEWTYVMLEKAICKTCKMIFPPLIAYYIKQNKNLRNFPKKKIFQSRNITGNNILNSCIK